MKDDEFRRSRRNRSKDQKLNFRFVVFLIGVVGMFSVLLFGLYRLQIEQGEQYAESTANQSIKSIAVKGSRGMITDINSVVLAKSEKAYNVTFYRENEDWDYPTKQLLEAISIVESYGGKVSVTSPLIRSEETGEWVFNFGTGISETSWNKRKQYFYDNNYISSSRYSTPQASFDFLCRRFGFTVLADGRYLLALDKNGNSVVFNTDDLALSITDEEGRVTGKMVDLSKIPSNRVAEYQVVDEEKVVQIIAINATMQDNAFLSLPVPFAEDVSYETVAEIEGRSMSMPWVGVTMGDKRVYPNGSLAATIIGYTGKIQNADYYFSDLQPAGYAMNDYIGQAGIESSMENWLTANITDRQGARVVEVDPQGKVTRELSYIAPQDGNTVKLTINAQYQAAAERYIRDNVNYTRDLQEQRMRESDWLETYKDKIAIRDFEEFPLKLATTGVLIVMDLRKENAGNILALAQYPNYDLNAMVQGGDPALQIVQDERGLLMNYAIQTRAEPGSIFKMVTGLAGLTNGELTPTETISDGGRFDWYTNVKEDMPKCWTSHPENHKDLNIAGGLTNSCNFFFYTVAGRLYNNHPGQELLYKYAAQMGLTSKTGIDLPGELRSIVGNQTNLYDPTVSLEEQMTSTPILVAASLKKHISNYAASYGISYDSARLDKCIKQLMDMAMNTPQDNWVSAARPIFMTELGMTRTMVMQAALMTDMWNYLNTIKWGGSQEIQMGVGQSITLLTPIAVVRYIGSLNTNLTVWNPNIVDSIISPEGEILSKRTASQFNTLDSAKEYLPYILDGLKGVVDEAGTAARQFRGWKYKAEDVMVGKTGTSQVTIGKVRLDLENNGWFVALTPKDDPEIALVSFIPNGFSGSYTVRAAKDFIEFYLDEKTKVDTEIVLPGGNALAP
ncbi:MAG: penicillin-binding transpeptidase domain-containing protein [Clostridia bacterium]|nr:penicillin-binding transpeptidase domain-containing protein [Clostridia bacterium]